MKRIVRYIIGSVGAVLLLCALYYFSYKNALSRLEENNKQQSMNILVDEEQKKAQDKYFYLTNGKVENKQETAIQTQVNVQENAAEIDSEKQGKAPENTDSEEQTDVQETAAVQPIRIGDNTSVLVEVVDAVTGITTTEDITEKREYLGYNRKELKEHLEEELSQLPEEEAKKGLTGSEIVSFSNRRVVIRKTYDITSGAYLYYLAVQDGEIVVYFHDKKTVFEHTGIPVIRLAEEDRETLLKGIYVLSTEELFALLESYSS